jgi:ATP-binding cassette subfamily B protein
LPGHDLTALALCVTAIVVSSVLCAASNAWEAYLNTRISGLVIRDLRLSLIERLHGVPIAFFSDTQAGAILNRVTGDVSAFESVLGTSLMPALANVATLVIALAAMMAFDWKLTLLAVASVPLMLIPSQLASAPLFRAQGQTRERYEAITAIIAQTLSVPGIVLMRMFGRERFESERFERAASELMAMDNRFAAIAQRFGAIVGSCAGLGPAAVWLGGGVLCIRYGVQAGVVVAFVALLARLYEPVTGFIGIHMQLAGLRAIFARIDSYLTLPTERRLSQPARAPRGDVRGRVEFRDVGFTYDDGRKALHDVSFSIEPGRAIALVGPSGAGKSTIAHLLTGLRELQTGSILIDDVDVRERDLQDLRGSIGIVTQDTYLWHDTVEANLRYARPAASFDEIVAAARAASIHDVISHLPDGYGTVVGDRGYKLSGGERQRLAIARVLLKNPRIIVLDEATSALDSQNEATILDAFGAAMRDRTSLIIAHRLSTIASADWILVIDGGAIVERGTHHDLLALGGLYAALYRQQAGDEPRVAQAV